jgi:hypothetical protein
MAALSWRGWRGIFLVFAQKTQGLGKQRKFLCIKAKNGRGRALKNVLTGKNGLFWGDLAEKQRGPLEKKTLFFVFLRLFGILSPARV